MLHALVIGHGDRESLRDLGLRQRTLRSDFTNPMAHRGQQTLVLHWAQTASPTLAKKTLA